jgi:hypothetical protein
MLKPEEIESIKEIGTLDGNPVKLIKTIGGFWCAAGKPRGKKSDEALAAGSHPAIVRHNVEKQYAMRFQPSLEKNELDSEPVVNDRSSLLSKENTDKGFKLYTINHIDRVEGLITHGNTTVATQLALTKAESLEIQLDVKIGDVAKAKTLGPIGKTLLKAFAEEATILNKENIEMASKPVPVAHIKKG